MKFVFIENPIAGNKDRQLLFKEVQSAFRWSDNEMIIESPWDKSFTERPVKVLSKLCGRIGAERGLSEPTFLSKAIQGKWASSAARTAFIRTCSELSTFTQA
mgnify:CR=1 FL=1